MKIRFENPKVKGSTTNVCDVFCGKTHYYARYSKKTKKIVIVRQNNLIRTLFLLLHEFGHYLIEMIFPITGRYRIHEIYDKHDRKIADFILRREKHRKVKN